MARVKMQFVFTSTLSISKMRLQYSVGKHCSRIIFTKIKPHFKMKPNTPSRFLNFEYFEVQNFVENVIGREV